MLDILSKYKDRLINLSSRNRSLVLRKIYKKRGFDLYRLKEFDCDIDNLLNFLLERKGSKYLVLDDPYKKKKDDIKKITEKIINLKNEEINSFSNQSGNNDEFNKKRQEIDEKYDEMLKDEIEKIEKEIKKLIEYSTSLNYLSREINAIEKETGRYELFIGYPFVEGRFQDNTFVRAPLLLFPVNIIKYNNKWYLKNIVDQDVQINKVFVFGFSKYNEIKLKKFETEFISLDDLGENKVKGLIKYLYENKITIQDSIDRKIVRFVDYSDKIIPNYLTGDLIIKNYLVLGQFPISNSIYNDYQDLEKTEVKNRLLIRLLVNNGEQENTSKTIESSLLDEKNDRLDILEKDMNFLTSLDYSQEKAVLKVNETDQLVIYGPPGTGKSQTIANIIGDAMAKGKTVLMVSQKRAALDVIYNRLSEISSKIILLHDANKDKKAFYKKVSQSINEMNEETDFHSNNGRTNHHSYIDKRARGIDTSIKSLEDIGVILHKPRKFGLTLQQMYSKSKGITSNKDLRYSDFRIFAKKNRFKDTTYTQLKEAIDNISDESIIDDYFKYRVMTTNNNFLKELKHDLDFFEAQDVIDKIGKINKSVEKVTSSINKDYILKRLASLYIERKLYIEDSNITNLVEEINEENNKDLLISLNNGRWWSIKYWLQYSKNKRQEELNRIEYDNKRKSIEKHLYDFNKDIKIALNNLSSFKYVLVNSSYYRVIEGLFKGIDLITLNSKIKSALNNCNEFRNLKFRLSTIGKLEIKLLDYIYKNSNNQRHAVELIGNILEFSILLNIRDIEKSEEERNSLMHYSRYDELTKNIQKLMEEKNEITPDLIVSHWNSMFKRVVNRSLYKEFKRQAGKKRALWPIRKYVTEFHELAFNIFPCWLLSPETVSDILPLTEGMFDLIIFDEASQMFIENSIPTVYRGKQVVIAGDDKQLKPSSTFKSKYDDIDEEELTNETAAALEEVSLLDLAKVNYDSVHLNYHYRSQYDELINFSNYAFYRGRLQVSPNIISSNINNPPIERIKAVGNWIDRKNTSEAEKVVELVSGIFKTRKNNETVGIITFNVTQKDLIQDLLEYKAGEDADFKVKYIAENDRKDGNEDVSLFVKNIENVQGDERDIIIFSIGYAPNENGRVSVNFGALSQDGGENRLNVAISRAKKKIFVVTSIEPEELSVDNTKNSGPKLFKKYLQYVREVSDGNEKNANFILKSLVDTDIVGNKDTSFDSDFEVEVYDELKKLGYNVKTQVGVSGYKIDLAIYDEKTSKYVLGIECDGAAYHSSKSARERDIHRQRYLESRGWKIVRIWSRDWWNNSGNEIKKVDKLLKDIFKNIEAYNDRIQIKNTLINNRISDFSKDIESSQSSFETNYSTTKQIKLDKFDNESVSPQKKREWQKQSQNYKPKIKRNKILNDKNENKENPYDNTRVWYGDTVLLRDISSNEVFEVELEDNPYNKELMKDIEKRVLNHKLSETITFNEYRYTIVEINKVNRKTRAH